MTAQLERRIDHDELNQRLRFAVDAALKGGTLTLDYFQKPDLEFEIKDDDTPATIADKKAEELIRERIEKAFPQDGVLGEEFGETTGTNNVRWVLDPVDGTKIFMYGIPLYGTMIGLEIDDKAVLGVIYFPGIGEIMYGAHGLGASWLARGAHGDVDKVMSAAQPARVSEHTKLKDSQFLTMTVRAYRFFDVMGAHEELDKACKAARGYGSCYGHMLVATGRAEIAMELKMAPWDCAPVKPIIEAAGGRFTDIKGNDTIHGGGGFSTNGHVHDAVLEIMNKHA